MDAPWAPSSSDVRPDVKPAAMEDITVGLLEYDWRRESDHPQPQPQLQPQSTPLSQPDASPVRQQVAPQQVYASIVPVAPAPPANLDPALVPQFFQSHLQSIGPVYPQSQQAYAIPVSGFCPGIFAATGPQPVASHQMASTSMSAPMPDPAANMLQMLESKLAGIQSSLKAMPRTGYQHRPRMPCEPMVMQQNIQTLVPPVTSVKPEPNDLDLDFVALVEAKNTPQEPTETQKRKAAEMSAKALDLKERNRQSAKASRERKKARVEQLHKQVEDLTKQNLDLAQTCKEVGEDNAQLRQELVEFGHKFDEDGTPVLPDEELTASVEETTENDSSGSC